MTHTSTSRLRSGHSLLKSSGPALVCTRKRTGMSWFLQDDTDAQGDDDGGLSDIEFDDYTKQANGSIVSFVDEGDSSDDDTSGSDISTSVASRRRTGCAESMTGCFGGGSDSDDDDDYDEVHIEASVSLLLSKHQQKSLSPISEGFEEEGDGETGRVSAALHEGESLGSRDDGAVMSRDDGAVMMVPATWAEIEVDSGPAGGDAATAPSLGPISALFDWPRSVSLKVE